MGRLSFGRRGQKSENMGRIWGGWGENAGGMRGLGIQGGSPERGHKTPPFIKRRPEQFVTKYGSSVKITDWNFRGLCTPELSYNRAPPDFIKNQEVFWESESQCESIRFKN